MQRHDYYDVWNEPRYKSLLYNRDWLDQIESIAQDQLLQDQVTMRIVNDEHLSQYDQENIQVEVEDGVVTLTGRVQHLISKPLAFLDAIYIPGVLGIQDDIRLARPPH